MGCKSQDTKCDNSTNKVQQVEWQGDSCTLSGKKDEHNKTGIQTIGTGFSSISTSEVEQLNLFHKGLRDYIVFDAIRYTGATHVVVGVEYGANTTLTVKNEHKNEFDQKNTTASASNEGSPDCEERENVTSRPKDTGIQYDREVKTSKDSTSVNEEFTIQSSGVNVPEDFRLPSSDAEAKKVTGLMIGQTSNGTNGKGTAQKYILYSLNSDVFKKYFSISRYLVAAVDNRFRATSIQQNAKWRIDQLAGLVQQKSRMSSQLDEMEKYKHCLTPADLTVARSSLCAFTNEDKKLRHELSNVVSQEAPGTHQIAAVEAVVKQFDFETASARCDEIYNKAKPKLEFAKLCDDLGVKYVDAADDIVVNRLALKDRDVYICFACPEAKAQDDPHNSM